METITSSLKIFSSTSICGKRQSGKLTLAWYFSSLLTDKPVTLISPFSKVFFQKKIQANLKLNSNLQPTLDNLIYFNLKSDWKFYKNNYGYSFFNEEIERIVRESNEVVIFHRIESFFELQDSNEIDEFVYNIIYFSLSLGKKIIFTLSMSSDNSDKFYDVFEKNIEYDFLISKRLYDNKVRDVELISSLIKVEYSKFIFEYNNSKFDFELLPMLTGNETSRLSLSFKIIVASESKYLINISKYLFYKECFELKIISPILSDIIVEIAVDRLCVVIFNPTKNQLESDIKKIGSVISNSNNKSIFISSKLSLRNQDKLKIFSQGFSHALCGYFYIDELILTVELAIEYHFYTKEIERIPDKRFIIYEAKLFNDFISVLLKKNIFFSIFKFKYETPVNEKDIKNSLWRSFDIVYYVKKDNVFYLFLINTLKRNLKSIIGKMKGINETIELVYIKESIDFNK